MTKLLRFCVCDLPALSLHTSMSGSGKRVALLMPPLGRAAALRMRLVADARPVAELGAAAGVQDQPPIFP